MIPLCLTDKQMKNKKDIQQSVRKMKMECIHNISVSVIFIFIVSSVNGTVGDEDDNATSGVNNKSSITKEKGVGTTWLRKEQFQDLQNSVSFTAESNHLCEINLSNKFSPFPKLEELILTQYLPDDLSSDFFCLFPNLKRFAVYKIADSNITSLPCGKNDSCCSQLESIRFCDYGDSYGEKKFIKLEIFRNLNIKRLSLEFMEIMFPYNLSIDLPNLTEFKVIREFHMDVDTNNLLMQLKPLKYFRALKLNSGEIKKFNIEFQTVPQMTMVDLSHNDIENINSNSFKKCYTLKSINLSFNSISDLTSKDESSNRTNIFNSKDLPKLEYLNLEHNEIFHLDYSMIPKTLRVLIISQNPISIFSDEKKHCEILILQEIYANWVSLDHLEDICFPPSTEILSLENAGISRLPQKTFSHLTNLKQLRLKGNDLIIVDRFALSYSNGERSQLMNFTFDRSCCEDLVSYSSFSNEKRNRIKQFCKYYHYFIHKMEAIPVHDNKSTNFCLYVRTCSDHVCDVCVRHKLEASLKSSVALRVKRNAMSDCGHLMLMDVPLTLPEDNTELYLDGNNFTTVRLDRILENYSHLKFLYLNKSNIYRIDGKIENLSSTDLEHLHLENNFIDYFPPILLTELTSLKSLYLQNNLLKQFNINVTGNLTLEYLHLENNSISLFDLTGKDYFYPIIRVDLQHNTISTVTLDICYYNIALLNFGNNKITDINVNCYNDQSTLEKLFLQNNHLTFLKSYTFADLSFLNELHLEGNNIHEMNRDTFYMLPRLKKLYLQRNKIKEINKIFHQVGELEELHLGENLLISISSSNFNGLEKLKLLHLNQNKITTLPSNLFANNKQLIEIHLEGNFIERINPSVFNDLQYLALLHLNNNSLREITSDPSLNLPSLIEFHLEHNQLTILHGNEFKNLRKVKNLFLHENELYFISEITFEAMTSLEMLTLHGNKLKRLEIWNFELSRSLKTVTIHQNPTVCECEYLSELKDFFSRVEYISNVSEVKCLPEENGKFYLLDEYQLQFCQSKDSNYGLFIVMGIFVLIVCLSIVAYKYRLEIQVILYSRFRVRFFYDESLDESKQFHAFVAYSYGDLEFVANELVPGLQNYRLCLHDRNFVVGAFIQQNIISAINSSCCTLIVFSTNFVKSQWCRFEFRAAHEKTLTNRSRPVLVIVLEDVDPKDLDDEMKLYLSTNTYLRWDDQLFWERLYFALPSLNGNDNERNDQGNVLLQEFNY